LDLGLLLTYGLATIHVMIMAINKKIGTVFLQLFKFFGYPPFNMKLPLREWGIGKRETGNVALLLLVVVFMMIY
jgi:hypothetical protein